MHVGGVLLQQGRYSGMSEVFLLRRGFLIQPERNVCFLCDVFLFNKGGILAYERHSNSTREESLNVILAHERYSYSTRAGLLHVTSWA